MCLIFVRTGFTLRWRRKNKQQELLICFDVVRHQRTRGRLTPESDIDSAWHARHRVVVQGLHVNFPAPAQSGAGRVVGMFLHGTQ